MQGEENKSDKSDKIRIFYCFWVKSRAAAFSMILCNSTLDNDLILEMFQSSMKHDLNWQVFAEHKYLMTEYWI